MPRIAAAAALVVRVGAAWFLAAAILGGGKGRLKLAMRFVEEP